MGDKSAIEWTDATWNPVVGCSVISPGCTNCYAMGMAHRIEKIGAAAKSVDAERQPGTHYIGTTKVVNGRAVWTGKVALAPHHILTAPLRWARPRRIFVNSMGDLFHESVPNAWIDRVFAVMALCPQHLFLVLTKRAERMREYMIAPLQGPWAGRVARVGDDGVARPETDAAWRVRYALTDMLPRTPGRALNRAVAFMDERDGGEGDGFFRVWPLPNVVLGVTAERQAEADERREHLKVLAKAGWRTFVSYEPALGPIDWRGWEFLSGMISGGESDRDHKSARPSHPDWHRTTRDWCAAHAIPYTFKQWGEWGCIHQSRPGDEGVLLDGFAMVRVGKERAGRLLDGEEHNAFPEIAA